MEYTIKGNEESQLRLYLIHEVLDDYLWNYKMTMEEILEIAEDRYAHRKEISC
jgi:hypothetical protein